MREPAPTRKDKGLRRCEADKGGIGQPGAEPEMPLTGDWPSASRSGSEPLPHETIGRFDHGHAGDQGEGWRWPHE